MLIKIIPSNSDYEISENGEVFSLKRNKVKRLSPSLDKDGYLKVVLYNRGNKEYKRVNRLVLMAFDRLPLKGEQCRHLDGNNQNNHYKNLKWGTPKENAHDRDKVHKTSNPLTGEKHHRCKLSDLQIKEIRDFYKTGHYTQQYLGNKYNVNRAHISYVVNNKGRNNT